MAGPDPAGSSTSVRDVPQEFDGDVKPRPHQIDAVATLPVLESCPDHRVVVEITDGTMTVTEYCGEEQKGSIAGTVYRSRPDESWDYGSSRFDDDKPYSCSPSCD